jgi:hypothetical protein
MTVGNNRQRKRFDMKKIRWIAVALVAVASMILLVGCISARITPLGAPKATELQMSHTTTTLEYKVPTIDVYECPVHGRVASIRKIKDGVYCEACLFEKLLND